MQRHDHYELDPAEREPLDKYYAANENQYQAQYRHQQRPPYPQDQHEQDYYDPRSDYDQPRPPQHQHNHYHHNQQQSLQSQNQAHPQQQYSRDPYGDSDPNYYQPSPRHAAAAVAAAGGAAGGAAGVVPTADASLDRLRAERRNDRDNHGWAGAPPPNPDLVSPLSSPQPHDSLHWSQDGVARSAMNAPPKSNVTPGADNFSASAAGGMAGIAYQVADRNARESGMEAVRNASPHRPNHPDQSYAGGPHLYDRSAAYGQLSPYSGDRDSASSMSGLGASAVPPGRATPGNVTPTRSPLSRNGMYTDDPYSGFSRPSQPALGVVDPHDIYDDGDDGINYGKRPNRNSMLSLGASSNRSAHNAVAATGAAAAAVGLASSRPVAYGQVSNHSASALETHNLGAEKHWGEKPKGKSKAWKLVIIGIVAIIIIAALALGIVFGVVLKKGGDSGTNGQSAADDQAANGDLDASSSEIRSLMSNPSLHKVFMGMDYTPLNTQYPDCLTFPPSQNNVTRDIAVLSKLTNIVRTYGTDCNQTEMVITAIDRLNLKGKMKMWLGVWQDKNETTNARQLGEMWNILDHHSSNGRKPTDYFKGLIVANEVLYREDMTTQQLSTLLSNVRTNLTAKSIDLPVASSDLGTDWKDASLAKASDYIMANIHPFFGGTPANEAASWTMDFWKNNIGANQKSEASKNVIAEYGWPSQGGTKCPFDNPKCTNPAVAGVSELNRVLQDWVCPALNNGTNYFWFSAFDEPWKIRFNTKDENWEDHWGLMDVNRNLKSGVQIPDCSGKESPAA